MDEVHVPISMMGADFTAVVYFTITEYGSPPIIDYNHGGDPGVDPEWDIDEIYLVEDRWDEDGPEFEATGAFFKVLSNNKAINDAILDVVNDEASERRYLRRRRAA